MKMIRYRYNPNTRKYVASVFTSLSFYFAFFGVTWLLCNFINGLVNVQIFYQVKVFSTGVLFILAVIFLAKVVKGSVKNKSFFSYIQTILVHRKLQKELLKSKISQKLQEEPVIEIPKVEVVKDGNDFVVVVPKIAGTYEADLDKIAEDVTSSLPKTYAVVTKKVSADKKKFIFISEPISTDLAFRPTNWEQLCKNEYSLTLQQGLEIDLAKSPHLATWGASGSGKSTVLIAILLQLVSNSTIVFIVDGKNEFASFERFVSKVAVENSEIMGLLKHVLSIVKQRQCLIAKEVLKTNRIGLTAKDIGLSPVVVMADEVASVLATFTSKEKKEVVSALMQIAQKGRSVGVFLIIASQSPATDVLPSAIREQFATKILLGTASGDIQRMAFGEAITSGDVEKFQGFYFEDGQTVTPQRFFVPDLYSNNLATISTFEKIYKNRKEKD